jgi:hypothetical protein
MKAVPPGERQCEFGAFPQLWAILRRYSLLQVRHYSNGFTA